MVWAHVACQITAILIGVAAGLAGLSLRRRGAGGEPEGETVCPGRYGLSRPRPALRGHEAQGWWLKARGPSRRRHIVLGAAFAIVLALGYGLGVWSVHRAGRDVLTSPHALVGTVAAMFVAVTVFLGTALVGRDDERLVRLHRLIGLAAFVLLGIQVVLGIAVGAG